MTHKTIMEVLKWARENNVMRIKCGEVEAEFAPAPIEPESSELQKLLSEQWPHSDSTLEIEKKKDEAQERKERDEMMYYSS
tara:strand:+ start:284 stop:526 length:243 start_codon:yes stop_codon:yes gene_type:complete